MTSDGGRPRSIGEVLDLLKGEFPDITISKIRFLEGQGLLDIERTPSGYRKFHDPDVARLKWILSQQREHFLPLRVIRERLARSGGEVPESPAERPAEIDLRTEDQAPRSAPEPAAVGARAVHAPTPGPPAAAAPQPAHAAAVPAGPAPEPGAEAAGPAEAPDNGDVEVTRTAEELAAAAGLDLEVLRELERFGLVTGHRVAGAVEYDADALAVARAAAGFSRHGVEARHLRGYLIAAEREAGLYEQLVLPLARQRTPAGRRAAAALLDELVEQGSSMRSALLRSAFREHFGPA
jgi:DNA-binding transcriptional MerR regulator